MNRSAFVLALLMFCSVLPTRATAQPSSPTSGFLTGWGSNTWGQINPASCCAVKPLPANSPGGPWFAFAAGQRVTVAVRPHGTVWEWGQSNTTASCTYLCPPSQVPGVHDVVAVATSFLDRRLALERDGTVWQWQEVVQRPPVQVSGLPAIAQVAIGTWFALALGRDGSVWQWTYTSNPAEVPAPHRVAGLPPVTTISAGFAHSLAVTPNGAVWTWGQAAGLASGNPQMTDPAQVPGLSGITAVAAGDRFSLALDRDGHVWSWGYNPYGELGLGGAGNGSDAPARITSLQHVIAVSAQAFHALALDGTGLVWAWGDNQNAEIGNGTVTPFGDQCGCVPAPTQVAGIAHAVAIAAGSMHNLALLSQPLRATPPPALRPCGPPPGPVPRRARLPLTVAVGESASQIAVSEGTHHLFLLRPGRFDDASGAYTCAGSVLILDLRTGKPLATVTVSKNPIAMLVDDRANRLFVIDGGARDDALHGDVRLLNERTGRLEATVPLEGTPGPGDVAVRASHLFVPLTNVPSTANHLALAVLGTGAGRLISSWPLDLANDRPVVNQAANRIFLHQVNGVVALDASSGQPAGSLDRFLCSGELHDDEQDGRIVSILAGASHNGVGSLCILDACTVQVTGGYDYGPNAGAELLLLDGLAHVLLLNEVSYGVGPSGPGLTARDSRTGRLLRRFRFQLGPAAVDGSSGHVLFAGTRGEVQALDPHTWRIVRSIGVPRGVVKLAVAQHPHRLIVLAGSGDSASVTFLSL